MEDLNFNYDVSPAFIVQYDRTTESINARFSFPYGKEATERELDTMDYITAKFNELAQQYYCEPITKTMLARFQHACHNIVRDAELRTDTKFELETFGFNAI